MKHEEVRQKKFGLTPRELEIVSLVNAGYSNKEIAAYFKIGEDNVRYHLQNIYDKQGGRPAGAKNRPKKVKNA